MSQSISRESLDYERYVDGLRRANAEMLRALELHHASHIAFEHGDDVESEKQYALAVEATRSIVAKFNEHLSPTPTKAIIVHVEGGLVQEVTGIPAGYEVRVEDYDTQNPGDDSWDADKGCVVSVYGGGGA